MHHCPTVFLPHPSIQTPVLNRLGEVLLADMLGAVEIGDRAGDLEDATVAAGGKAEAFGDEFEEAVASFVRLAVSFIDFYFKKDKLSKK